MTCLLLSADALFTFKCKQTAEKLFLSRHKCQYRAVHPLKYLLYCHKMTCLLLSADALFTFKCKQTAEKLFPSRHKCKYRFVRLG